MSNIEILERIIYSIHYKIFFLRCFKRLCNPKNDKTKWRINSAIKAIVK